MYNIKNLIKFSSKKANFYKKKESQRNIFSFRLWRLSACLFLEQPLLSKLSTILARRNEENLEFLAEKILPSTLNQVCGTELN